MDKKLQMGKKYLLVFLAFQIVLLGVLSFRCLTKERKQIDVSLDQWQAWLIEYDGSAWYIDESFVENNAGVKMIWGPYVTVPKGSYTISVHYSTESEGQFCGVAAGDNGEDNNPYLKGSGVELNPRYTSTKFHIEVEEDVDNFEVQVFYSGKGYLKIHEITITENKVHDIRCIACLFFAFVLLDLVIFFAEPIRKYRRQLLLLLGIALLASLPEMIGDYFYGHDIYFHLLRIDGIAQEIRLGNIPARVHSLSLNGYGYPVSIFYGDLFLYLPAMLRILGFSVVTAYKVYVFAINAATAVIAYLCFRKMYAKQNIAMIASLVYTTSAYRMLDIYVRAAVGEYTAMMAFPVLALAIYGIYTKDDKDNWREYRKNAVYLALGMSLLITSHVLSTEMVVFFLVLICIVMFKKTLRKNTIKVYGMAVGLTLLFTAYFVVPFLDYMLHVDTNINHTVGDKVAKIQEYSAYIAQYFVFFERTVGVGSANILGRMQLTPGMVLMAAFVIGVYLWAMGKANKRMRFCVGFAAFALLIASNIFPWDYLAAHFKLFNMLAQVQYSWRYIGISTLFLTLAVCEILLECRESVQLKKAEIAVVAMAVVMTCWITGDVFDRVTTEKGAMTSEVVDTYDTASIDPMSVGTEEYVRTGTDTDELNGDYNTENLSAMQVLSENGSELILYCETAESTGTVEVPLLNYKGYHVRDDQGNQYEIYDGTNNVIAFSLPANFAGNITVYFEEPKSWRVAEAISVISLLGLIIVCWRNRNTKEKTEVSKNV